MASSYSPEVKAQVIAEWMAGATELGLSQRYSIPRTTVRRWVEGHERSPKQTPEYDLDKMAWELVGDSFAALQAILRKAQDDSWLHKQDANNLAIFFGVTSDKLIRLLSVRRDEQTRDSATAEPIIPERTGEAAQPEVADA